MKFYQIRHKPTGLFFKPSKHGSKSNLSKKGKVYQIKPSFRYLGERYHHPMTEAEYVAKHGPQPKYFWFEGYETRAVVLEEWEIVEYNTDIGL